MNYYNEIDPKAAAWLRELIKRKLIPHGDVDTRSITEISAHELTRYTQCHFFAGIGGWSLALQLAGWPEDRPVWTGSCPCQPFSSAGKGLGTADERHLWPIFFDLIRQCRPQCVFGEQVANAIGKGWLDGVSSDLEGADYACGAAVLGAHSVGAPHLRQRLFWVANAAGGQREQFNGAQGNVLQRPADHCTTDELANAGSTRREGSERNWQAREERHAVRHAGECGGDYWSRYASGGLAIAHNAINDAVGSRKETRVSEINRKEVTSTGQLGGTSRSILPDDYWSRFDLIPCRDGKTRRLEPGLAPLAHGIPARVVRLRGYGNAIVPQVAAEFVSAFMQ